MKVLIFLLVALLIGQGMAMEQQTVTAWGNTTKDGFTYPFKASTTINVADPPPTVDFTMYITRANSTATEPYAGPYKNGEGIRVHARAQLHNETDCADRITVDAQVFDPMTGGVVWRRVIDSIHLEPNGVCDRVQLGADWDYLAGFGGV